MALALISAPLLVRHLGVADFGWWVTITSLVFIVNGLTELGMTAVGVREYSVRDEVGRAALIGDLLAVRIVAALAGMLVAVGFATIAGYEDTRPRDSDRLAKPRGQRNPDHLRNAAARDAQARLDHVLDLARQVVTVGLIAALVLAGAELLPFFAVPLLAGLTALGLTLPLVVGRIPLVPAVRLRRAWRLVRQTLPYAAATAFGIIYFRVEIILMFSLHPTRRPATSQSPFAWWRSPPASPGCWCSAFPILARAARTIRRGFAMRSAGSSTAR